mmetsp:Transcript_21910/g.57183  ORF Transcript_21910/g.57183 Transcript_21910/m.57183 type:complete len:300 (+) Transcript_21910:926-1825(+)
MSGLPFQRVQPDERVRVDLARALSVQHGPERCSVPEPRSWHGDDILRPRRRRAAEEHERLEHGGWAPHRLQVDGVVAAADSSVSVREGVGPLQALFDLLGELGVRRRERRLRRPRPRLHDCCDVRQARCLRLARARLCLRGRVLCPSQRLRRFFGLVRLHDIVPMSRTGPVGEAAHQLWWRLRFFSLHEPSLLAALGAAKRLRPKRLLFFGGHRPRVLRGRAHNRERCGGGQHRARYYDARAAECGDQPLHQGRAAVQGEPRGPRLADEASGEHLCRIPSGAAPAMYYLETQQSHELSM